MTSLGAWTISMPWERAAATKSLILGAISATRRAAPAQVWVSHMSQMMTAVSEHFHDTVELWLPRRAWSSTESAAICAEWGALQADRRRIAPASRIVIG